MIPRIVSLVTGFLFIFIHAYASVWDADVDRISYEYQPARYPVISRYSIGLGGRSAIAQYISPMAYSGPEISLTGNFTKTMRFSPEKAVMSFHGEIAYSSLGNSTNTAKMTGIDAGFRWQMRWMLRLNDDFIVTAGGGIGLSGGALAILRNSNNPVNISIIGAIEGGCSVSKRFRIGRIPAIAAESLSFPLLGAFFMPEYGETFYEIYLGNKRGLAHFGYPGNFPGLDNEISISLDLGNTALQLGYLLKIDNTFANSLKTKSISNMFVIGIIPHGLGLKRKHSVRQFLPY